jgi:nucleotide-binding universal stress UspA family protein
VTTTLVACPMQLTDSFAHPAVRRSSPMSMNTVQSPKRYEIVVGFDLSELAERALEEAIGIAEQRAPSELHVVTVAQPVGRLVRLPGEADGLSEELARETVRLRIAQIVEDYQARHGRIGVERVAVYLLTSAPIWEPGRLIADLARAVDADLIMVGTHGRTGVARVLLGSVAQQVARDADRSVYVVRPADFVRGTKVPAIEPPLKAGESQLRHFEHRRTYHYVDKVAHWTNRTMPAS